MTGPAGGEPAQPQCAAAAPSIDPADRTLARLDDQICWYDREAGRNNFGDKAIRIVSIAAAATIPVLAAMSASPVVTAALGSIVVVAQASGELFQFQRNWVTFGATREALKREKFLFAASAGGYANSKDPHRLLAERVEGLVGQETSGWMAAQHLNGDGDGS